PGSDKRGIMKLAVIAGDGIGPEVVGQALRVLDKVAPGAQITEYDLGAKRYHATGELMPDGVLDDIRTHDAILLGAIGDPSVPSGLLERNLLLDTRFALDHHVNLRPSKLYPGMDSPLADAGDIDFLVVREGTEGPYTGTGGVIRKNTPDRKSTRLNSSHVSISYAVFCLKKKKKQGTIHPCGGIDWNDRTSPGHVVGRNGDVSVLRRGQAHAACEKDRYPNEHASVG